MVTRSLIFGLSLTGLITACVPNPDDNASASTGTFTLTIDDASAITYEGRGKDPLLYGKQEMINNNKETSIIFRQNYQNSSLDYTDNLILSFFTAPTRSDLTGTFENTPSDTTQVTAHYESNGVFYEQTTSQSISGSPNNAYFTITVTQCDPPGGRIVGDFEGYICRNNNTGTVTTCPTTDLKHVKGSFNVQNTIKTNS